MHPPMWVIPKALSFDISKTSYLTFTFAVFQNQCKIQCNSRIAQCDFRFSYSPETNFFCFVWICFGVRETEDWNETLRTVLLLRFSAPNYLMIWYRSNKIYTSSCLCFLKALHRIWSICIKHMIKDIWLMILDVSSNLNDYTYKYLAEQALK